MKEFEAASGLVIHRIKSKFVLNRVMTAAERRSLNDIRTDASIAERAVSLGTPIERGVVSDDVLERGFSRVGERLDVFRQTSMSWTMRVLAIKMFLFSLVSYSDRLFLMSPSRTSSIANDALRLLTPVPFSFFFNFEPLLPNV